MQKNILTAATTLALLLSACSSKPEMLEAQGRVRDTVPPTVSLSISPGSLTAAGAVGMAASASDNVGVKRVDFYDGTTLLGSDSSAPYTFSRSYGAADSGNRTIKAVALDAAGNMSSASQVLAVNIPASVPGSWRDDFSSLDLGRWSISQGWVPFWAKNFASGSWGPQNVWVEGGHLKLRLDMDAAGNGIGAELSSNAAYGYGTYTARMRSASTSCDPSSAGAPQGGSISAFFNYVNDSETEIDIELPGAPSDQASTGLYQTVSRENHQWSALGFDHSQGFHEYQWVWTASSVAFKVDGRTVHTVLDPHPTRAAPLMFNLWPTNNTSFGGLSSAGSRCMLVDWVSFTPGS